MQVVCVVNNGHFSVVGYNPVTVSFRTVKIRSSVKEREKSFSQQENGQAYSGIIMEGNMSLCYSGIIMERKMSLWLIY